LLSKPSALPANAGVAKSGFSGFRGKFNNKGSDPNQLNFCGKFNNKGSDPK